jgi:hypothetical protein
MRGRGILAGSVAAAVLVSGPAANAMADTVDAAKTHYVRSASVPSTDFAKKKKKKKGKPAVTRSSSVALPPSSNATAAATCPKGTHMTGGGFQVTPAFNPVGDSGTRALTVTSHPSGARSWAASGGAYSTPPTPGAFAAQVRCEKNSRGRLAITLFGSHQVTQGTGGDSVLTCPPGTHVISGGYAGAGLASFNFSSTSHRIIVLQSRRTSPTQWTITAYNNVQSPGPAALTVYATCEFNGKGQAVSEASSFVQVADNARTSAQAACGRKAHVVSGGFLVSPATFPGNPPLISIDDSVPVGKRAWRIGLWEYPVPLPVGSSLLATAYCKKG